MDHKAYDKLLQSHGIGKRLFGSGNLLFDPEFYAPKASDFFDGVRHCKAALSGFEYVPHVSDCDNYAFMFFGQMLAYFAEIGGGPWQFGPVWGTLNRETHAWFFGFPDGELTHVDYGKIITPVSFTGLGSISA